MRLIRINLKLLALLLPVLGFLFFASFTSAKTQDLKELRPIITRPFRSVCDIPSDHFAHCHAKVVTQSDGSTPLSGGTPFTGSMTPAAFHTAYKFPCTPGGPVSANCATPESFGPVIAIVDAFHTPNIENDLGVYSSTYGLSSCTKANGCLQVVNENGGSTLPSTVDSGWAMETSMDVEIAHGICQTCKILLVEASSNTYFDLGTAVNTAVNMGAVAVSNSYGGGEWNGETGYDSFFNHPGVAITASSGDGGYGTSFPAASSGVVAVGGTTLNLYSDLSYASETVWNGAGSGCSLFESVNTWQVALSNWGQTGCSSARGIADISADADPNTGAAVYDTTPYAGQTGWWQVGGTSLSSPIIAAAFAMGAPVPGGTKAASVLYNNYSLTNFNDITSGLNGSCGTIMCSGVAGYDGPTGLGTPNGLGAFGGTPVASPTPTLTPSPTSTPTPTLTPTPTPVDLQPPTVSITSPTDGSRVFRNNITTIRASASDNVKVAKVEFYINGNLLSTDTTSSYTASWKVPNTRNVTYTISAKAYDTSNNTATTSINVTSR